LATVERKNFPDGGKKVRVERGIEPHIPVFDIIRRCAVTSACHPRVVLGTALSA